jgi:hypothetical protein
MFRCLRYVFFMLALAANVQAERAATDVASQILSLCGACQVLLIGERHQQPESPPLFLDLVTRLVKRGERTLIGLEIPAARQDALDAMMAGARSPAGIAHPIIDSPAYQRLLLELSALQRDHGALVTVAAIDNFDGDMPRDEAMASHIQRHLAAGDVERVVALVGNLHTIRKMEWAKDAGRQLPYLAERLIDAKITVTSVMQALSAACDQLRHPVLYTTKKPQAFEAVSRQLDVLNHHASMDSRQASDGIVIWACQASD